MNAQAGRFAWLWSGAMALLVCGPLLTGRGFALTHDMVFVPQQPFKGAWLGLDGSVPRAVPSDALVAAFEIVVPGDLLQKAVLVALLLLAGAGAATMVSSTGLPGQLAASTLYVWNPYVFERLAMGQWALLCGYAALPWVVVSCGRVRRGDAMGWPLLTVSLCAAAFTSPTGGVLSAIVCCALLIGRDRASTWRSVLLCTVVNLPWIMPSLLYGGGIPSDRQGVSAFAARADAPYGVLGSLLSLGGIWNRDVVPPGRDSWALAGSLLLVCLGALVGVLWVERTASGPTRRRLAVVAVIGLGLAVLPAVRGGLPVMEWVDANLPGGGLLRDSQKWVGLLALVEAIGIAALVSLLRQRWRSQGATAITWLMVATVLVPVAVTLSLAWGLSGRLEPVRYPDDWKAVASLVDRAESQGARGDIAVLPWSIYRQYGWNGNRPVLDPAPRFLEGNVVIADTLVVGDRAVAGEEPRAAKVGTLLARGGDVSQGLRRLGIGLVVVERGTPGVGDDVALTGERLYDGRWLQLWDLGTPGPALPRPSRPVQVVIVAADIVAAGVFLVALGLLASARARRYTRR